MKNYLLLIVIIVSVFSCKTKEKNSPESKIQESESVSEIGIGIISIKFDDKTKIDFYETHELKNKLKTVEFFNDESINSWNIKNLTSHKEWLQPESMWLDYGQFRFRCKTKNTNCYEIYVSEFQTMWIRNQDFTEYLSVETYLKNMFSGERQNKITQQIYSKPFTKSEIIEFQNDCFNVKQRRAECIEIEKATNS